MAHINSDRLLSDLRELASIGPFETGVDRVALSAADIVKQSLVIAGDLCIYTNQNHVIEALE